jgi:hypothetical protein
MHSLVYNSGNTNMLILEPLVGQSVQCANPSPSKLDNLSHESLANGQYTGLTAHGEGAQDQHSGTRNPLRTCFYSNTSSTRQADALNPLKCATPSGVSDPLH